MKRRHKSGFTLVEIIVSIALLAIIALFMLPMSAYSIKFSKWNDIRLTAMNLAYSQTEWLKTLDYKTELGLNQTGYSPQGTVKSNLYMNKTGSDPLIIEGIEYRLLTSIYWESAESTNGDFVANATKKLDVTVIAKDPLLGTQKTYSVMGSLVAFEGERIPSSNVPLKVRVISGENFDKPAKNVKVIINNISNTLITFGLTDNEGKVYFTELINAKYNVIPDSWQGGDMMSRPTGITGTGNDQSWRFNELIEIKALDAGKDFVEQVVSVDYPGYIVIPSYPSALMDNTIITMKPKYTPPEGVMMELNMNTNLTKLISKKIWRAWEYDYTMKRSNDVYYFADANNGNLWDGKFPYMDGAITNRNLKLSFGMNTGSFKKELNGTVTLEIEFTSEITGNINDMLYTLYDGATALNITNPIITQSVPGKNNKFKINLSTNPAISGNSLKFVIDNAAEDIIKNTYGMKLVQDRNYCDLILK